MTKILECLSCGTCYESPPDFPADGRKVRCAKCGKVWYAVATERRDEPDPGPDMDPDDDDIVFRENEAVAVPDAGEEAEAAEAERVEAAAEPEPEEDDLELADVDHAVAAAPAEPDEPEPEPGEDDLELADVGHAMAAAPPAPEEPAVKAPAVEVPAEMEAPVQEVDLPYPVAEPAPAARAHPTLAARLRRVADATTLGWAALALFFAGVFYFAYDKRVAVVRALPGTAWAYEQLGIAVNIRGLSFGPVDYHWAVEAGRPILEVEGEIRNTTEHSLTVPTVVFALRNAVQVEVYQWAADIRAEPLPGGERTLFLARIPSPPKSIESVQVRFAKSR